MEDKIKTNIGVPQLDCLGPIMFTLYLADALKVEISTITEGHNYTDTTTTEDLLPGSLKDHAYSSTKEDGLPTDQQYIDETLWVAVDAKCITEKNQERSPRTDEEENSTR